MLNFNYTPNLLRLELKSVDSDLDPVDSNSDLVDFTTSLVY